MEMDFDVVVWRDTLSDGFDLLRRDLPCRRPRSWPGRY